MRVWNIMSVVFRYLPLNHQSNWGWNHNQRFFSRDRLKRSCGSSLYWGKVPLNPLFQPLLPRPPVNPLFQALLPNPPKENLLYQILPIPIVFKILFPFCEVLSFRVTFLLEIHISHIQKTLYLPLRLVIPVNPLFQALFPIPPVKPLFQARFTKESYSGW